MNSDQDVWEVWVDAPLKNCQAIGRIWGDSGVSFFLFRFANTTSKGFRSAKIDGVQTME